MELKIIEPVHKPLIEFDNPDEFNTYYHKHKDDIDGQTTHMLNRKYKIVGYKITKLKGVLCLKKIGNKCDKTDSVSNSSVRSEHEINKNNELIEANIVDSINARITILEQRINEIIEYINNTLVQK